MQRLLWICLGFPFGALMLIVLGLFSSQVKLAWQDFPPAHQGPVWSVLNREEIPSIVTLDADGERRLTQVWIAVVANQAYLRTADSVWYENLVRNPRLDLRIAGLRYRCSTRFEQAQERVSAVHQAFRKKYPKRSAIFRLFGVSTPRVIALHCEGGASAYGRLGGGS